VKNHGKSLRLTKCCRPPWLENTLTKISIVLKCKIENKFILKASPRHIPSSVQARQGGFLVGPAQERRQQETLDDMTLADIHGTK
jgi:hypothetical protein